MNPKTRLERRRTKRFRIQEGVYVALGPNYSKLGQILDLSMQGLTFRYIAQRNTSDDSSELEIFTVDHGFFLRKIPFTTVSDCETGDGIPFSPLRIRHCCVEFGILTPFQKSQLAYFLDNYTTRSLSFSS